MEINQNLYKKRRATNLVGLTLSMTAMALGLTVLLPNLDCSGSAA